MSPSLSGTTALVIFSLKSNQGSLVDLVTNFVYPDGVEYVSSVLSAGTINMAGTKWKVPGPLFDGGTVQDIKLTLEIVDMDAFEDGDRLVRGHVLTYSGEIIIANNIVTKLIA